MKVKDIVEKTADFFRQKKIDSPRYEAELLISDALKMDRIGIYLKFDQPLSEAEIDVCRQHVRRRGTGEPVAYICGHKDFYGHTFEVNKNVLIPRPETEQLLEVAEAWIKKSNKENLVILELGAGSGCISLSLLHALAKSPSIKKAQVLAVDISEQALLVATGNAERHKLKDSIKFLNLDASISSQKIFDEVSLLSGGLIDILISNPPYISKQDDRVEQNVLKFEPSLALFAEQEGYHYLKLWSQIYSQKLAAESICVFEMGCDQGAEMKNHFRALDIFDEVEVFKDLSDHDRIICGVKNG